MNQSNAEMHIADEKTYTYTDTHAHIRVQIHIHIRSIDR